MKDTPLTAALCERLRDDDNTSASEDVVTALEHAASLERELTAARKDAERLAVALKPLMLLKSQNCDGQIGWRGQPKAIAGYIRVKDILCADAALTAHEKETP